MKDGKFLTMAFESSCDETSVAIVADGRDVLSNVISSQIDIFKNYGGVVPEIAARHHLENINQVVDEALKQADVTLDDIDLIGVTYGPGLVGALLIGVATAKAIAFGDFNYYWIAEREGYSFKRLNELFATTGQVGFMATERVDGKIILPEAVKILQVGKATAAK